MQASKLSPFAKLRAMDVTRRA